MPPAAVTSTIKVMRGFVENGGAIVCTDPGAFRYDIDGTDDRMLTTMLDHQFTIDDAMSDDLVTLPDTATVHVSVAGSYQVETQLMVPNMAVVAPIPTARVKTTTAVKPGRPAISSKQMPSSVG